MLCCLDAGTQQHTESHSSCTLVQVQMQMAPVCVESKRHIHAIDQGVQQVSQRFQRRHPSACQELMYMFDGDDNGVCHFIGTSYGSQEWVNPVLSGQIKVRMLAPANIGIG